MKPYEIVLKLMEEQNITRQILTTRTGIPYNTIKNYLNGSSEIPMKRLKIIAKALNVTTSYLLGENHIRLRDNNSGNWNWNKELESLAKDYNINCSDVAEFITNDETFINTFMIEAIRVISYASTPATRDEIEDLYTRLIDTSSCKINFISLNENAISKITGIPYSVILKDFSKSLIMKKVDMLFDKYIQEKLKK